jgi:hypothetical protein
VTFFHSQLDVNTQSLLNHKYYQLIADSHFLYPQMKISLILPVAVLLGLTGLANAQSTTAAPAIKVEIKEVKLEQQMTPIIQVTGVTEKRWKPKTWIELDVGLKIKLPKSEGGDDASAASLEIRYFVGTNHKSKDGKTIIINGNITYQNVPADTENHALAYISPSTLQRALMKENGNKGDTPAYGVDIYYNGQPAATSSSGGGRWWANGTENNTDKFTFIEGITPKSKTPFSILWGDYDLQVSDSK